MISLCDETNEPLHPDLIPYLEIGNKAGWDMLRSPLVFQVPYSSHFNAICNRQYIAKKQRIEKAMNVGEWDTVIALIDGVRGMNLTLKSRQEKGRAAGSGSREP